MRDLINIVESAERLEENVLHTESTAYPIKDGEVRVWVREMRGGRYSFGAWVGDRRIAYGEFQSDAFGEKGSVEEITVAPEFRRRGVASAIYNHFEKIGFRVVPSDDVRPDGQAFWNARGNP